MKKFDLNQGEQPGEPVACDVCIVGSGAAGLYLAHRLLRDGLRVVVLEAGGELSADAGPAGFDVQFSGAYYAAAREGRAFGWGGTTTRWGGCLIAHGPEDLRPNDPTGAVWSHIVDVVQRRSGKVLSGMGLGGGGDFFDFPAKILGPLVRVLGDAGLGISAGDYLPFGRRKLTYLVEGSRGEQLRVYLNAVADSWEIRSGEGGDALVAFLGARSEAGHRLRIAARAFVIAAGTIESARILLEIDRQTGERILPRAAAVGRYLSDHLSLAIAKVPPADWARANRLFRPRFFRGRMRSFRFTDREGRGPLPRFFTHFLFLMKENEGFKVAHKVLASLQRGVRPGISPREFTRGLSGLFALAYHRYVKFDLHIPETTPVHFQLDMEQNPKAENAVTLSDETDRFGRPQAIIRWGIDDEDRLNIERVASLVLEKWPGQTQGLPALTPIPLDWQNEKPYDAYHPVGTCRMGTDAESVVDLKLGVRGVRNLSVLSTAVFPSAGTANPTFSMLCLGDALADQLAQDLGGSVSR